jgi:hypothetical protein
MLQFVAAVLASDGGSRPLLIVAAAISFLNVACFSSAVSSELMVDKVCKPELSSLVLLHPIPLGAYDIRAISVSG